MKFIYSIVFLCFSFIAQSQIINNSVNQTISKSDTVWLTHEQYVNHVFGQLNMTEVTSNFLLQRSHSYFEPLAYDGKNNNDSLVHSFSDGMYLYNTLYYSALDTSAANGLSHPTTLRNSIAFYTSSHTIPIVLVNRAYHSIKQDALLTGLFNTSGDSTLLYDAPGRTVSPYERHRLFISFGVVDGEKYYSNGDVKFNIIPSSLNLSDTTATSVQIDFGDGRGFVDVTMDGEKSIYYNSSGIKVIRLRQGELESSFSFDFVKQDVYFHPEPPVEDTELGLRNSVLSVQAPSVSKYLGCDGILDKPILLVEGFEIEKKTSARQILESMQPLVSRLMAQGYDFVVVKFANNSASIIDNAASLTQAITQINNDKIGDNKLNVIGLSMGGLIAKYCLKDMEDKNIVHNVENYFSYDAPHQGAYVPLGLQNLLSDASYAVRDIREDPQVSELLTKLNSTAGKQLLQFHYNDIGNQRANFAAAYAAKGYPVLCNNYGIANGRADGVGLGYSGGSQLMDMKGSAKVVILGTVLKHQQQLWSLSTSGSTISYLSNKGIAAIFGLKGLRTFSSRTSAAALQNYEAVPGSVVAMVIPYGSGLAQSFKKQGSGTVDFFGKAATTFVSTVSALDLNNQNYGSNGLYAPQNPYFNIQANNVIGNHITPFDDVIISTSNDGHLTMDYAITNFIFNKVFGHVPATCQSLCENAPTFSGIEMNCSTGEKRITMKNAPNGVAINWVLNGSAGIATGQGTNSISFYTGSNGTYDGYVQLTLPGCPTMNFPFSISTIPQISGPAGVCSEATFTIPNLPSQASVAWSVDYSFVEIISSTNNSVTLAMGEGGFFKLKASITSPCGNYEVESAQIVSGQPYYATVEAYCEDGCGGTGILCTNGNQYSEFNNILTYQTSPNPAFPLTLHYKFVDQNDHFAYEGSKLLTDTNGYLYLPENLAPDFYTLLTWVTGGPCNNPSEVYGISVEVRGCSSSKIIAYPNPATTEINVGYRNLAEARTKQTNGNATRFFDIKLMDNKGNILKISKNREGEDQITIPVADIPAGTYFLHIIEGKSISKQQIIINR